MVDRRLSSYTVIGINSTVADAQSRSNYILVFTGLRRLARHALQATLAHEIGHGELVHIPQGTVNRVFNDIFWSPIVPQMPGLTFRPNSTMTLTAKERQASKLLPQLVASAFSRSNELDADAFAIRIGLHRLNNPCGMIDAIRTFEQGQPNLPFASHPNRNDRLTAARQLLIDQKADPCSTASIRSYSMLIYATVTIRLLSTNKYQ
jgi:Zn-dependent protease with chaperone function